MLGLIQRVLEFRSSPHLITRELEVKKDIDVVLKHEELLWFQKSRSECLSNEDRNTHFFHNRAKARRKLNRVEGLNIGEEGWCFDDVRLKQHVVEFFKELYTAGPRNSRAFHCHGVFPSILVADQDCLTRGFVRGG